MRVMRSMAAVTALVGKYIFADWSRSMAIPDGMIAVGIPARVAGVDRLLTMVAALSCSELAAMLPKAGGQYVFFREAYGPLFGFLFGWTMFLVVQTGTIAAVAVAFANFSGVSAAASRMMCGMRTRTRLLFST